MSHFLFYPAGTGKPIAHAVEQLQKSGIPVIDHPSPDVTHLLMDIPLTSTASLQVILNTLPSSTRIISGNIPSEISSLYACYDLLKDDLYLYHNAAITAECALQIAASHSPFIYKNAKVLVIGWGRIGKMLAAHLRHFQSSVAVYSHTPVHIAEICVLGIHPVTQQNLLSELPSFDIIFNTVPHPVLSEECASKTHAVKYDLASAPGIAGNDVIRLNRLPARYAPKSSGILIADTIGRLLKEEHICG